MPIDMIQDFRLETDELKIVDAFLRTYLPIKLKHRGNRLYLNPSSSGFHHDGSKWCWDVKVVEIDKKFYVVDTNRTYHGTGFMKIHTIKETAEEAARVASEMNKDRKTKPRWKHVVTIGGLYSKSDTKPPKDAVMYPGYDSLIAAVLEHLKGADSQAFMRECYDSVADGFDGTVRMGYRLADAHNYLDEMHVTLCHILYGK